MRVKKLNARLSAMASYVGAGKSVADIGADHGYLPIHLIREGISPFAVLTDVHPGPLEKTRVSLAKSRVAGDRIELRLGDGLQALDSGAVDIVVIAGMGGETIISILAADKVKAESFWKYILQPRTKADKLRDWLADRNWEILAEERAYEKGRPCDIIVCSPGIKKEMES